MNSASKVANAFHRITVLALFTITLGGGYFVGNGMYTIVDRRRKRALAAAAESAKSSETVKAIEAAPAVPTK
eukprot:gene1024-1111_t